MPAGPTGLDCPTHGLTNALQGLFGIPHFSGVSGQLGTIKALTHAQKPLPHGRGNASTGSCKVFPPHVDHTGKGSQKSFPIGFEQGLGHGLSKQKREGVRIRQLPNSHLHRTELRIKADLVVVFFCEPSCQCGHYLRFALAFRASRSYSRNLFSHHRSNASSSSKISSGGRSSDGISNTDR
jgi:hypothetical protein